MCLWSRSIGDEAVSRQIFEEYIDQLKEKEERKRKEEKVIMSLIKIFICKFKSMHVIASWFPLLAHQYNSRPPHFPIILALVPQL